MKITLNLVEPLSVTNQWPLLAPGFRKVLEHTSGDQTESSIYSDLTSQRLFLMVIMIDDKYAGFSTGKIDPVLGSDKVFLTVVHTYLIPTGSWDALIEVQRQLGEFGASKGCNMIRFFSIRDKAFERRFKGIGWTPSYVEFVKQIGGENGR